MLITLIALMLTTPSRAADTVPFALDLYREVSGKPGNVFFSPYSLESALAMTSAGARGQTFEEMSHALHLTADPGAAFRQQRIALESSDPAKPVLAIANRLWGRAGETYEVPFLEQCKRDYDASLETVDFAGDPEGARKTINDWVEKQTRDKIRDLLPQGTVKKNTNLVLTNAIYFKGAWRKPFKKDLTEPQTFHLDKGTEQADFMHQTETMVYWENDDFQAVRIPYSGNSLVMSVFLPKKGKSLKNFTAKTYSDFSLKYDRHPVTLSLPKFHIDYGLDARAALEHLGMKLAFTPDADFTGIRKPLKDDPLYISAVIHKAFVDVNEEGTEAAAATGVVMAVGAAYIKPNPPKTFIADHPFLFVIEQEGSGSPLFFGRVSKP